MQQIKTQSRNHAWQQRSKDFLRHQITIGMEKLSLKEDCQFEVEREDNEDSSSEERSRKRSRSENKRQIKTRPEEDYKLMHKWITVPTRHCSPPPRVDVYTNIASLSRCVLLCCHLTVRHASTVSSDWWDLLMFGVNYLVWIIPMVKALMWMHR